MSYRYGNDHHLWIQSATPGTFNRIKGNTTLSRSGSGSIVNTTTKQDFPNETGAPGTRSLSISAGFNPDLPDANGFTRLVTIANGASPTSERFQIRKGGLSGNDSTDVVFDCVMFVTGLDGNYEQNEVTKASCTLVPAAAPTVDLVVG